MECDWTLASRVAFTAAALAALVIALGVIGMGTPAAIPTALLFGVLAATGTCFD
jgi:hypothetical protein